VLALLCLVYFLVILDAAIVRLALPSIDLAFGLSPASQTWVANAYMLSFGTLLLLGGRLADLLGRKRILLVGVGVFTLASLACGLASSGAMLIAARALQGLGAAAMTPAALSILMRTFPEGAERNRAIGAWGATGGMAATAATAGWISAQTVALFALSLALFGTLAAIERRATAPLVPRRIAGSRTLLAANLGLGLTAASIYGMAFIISLYGQEVLGYSALTFGVVAVVLPFGVALGAAVGQALVTRRGPRAVSATGIAGLAVGFVLLARLPVHGSYVTDLLPAFLLFGVPLGLAFTAYSVATLTGVAGRDAGLASGLNNTFEQVGGAVGTALMATIATARTEDLLHAGAGHMFALDRGIQLSFATAIAFPVLGLIVSLLLLRQTRSADAIDPLGAAATPATCAE